MDWPDVLWWLHNERLPNSSDVESHLGYLTEVSAQHQLLARQATNHSERIARAIDQLTSPHVALNDARVTTRIRHLESVRRELGDFVLRHGDFVEELQSAIRFGTTLLLHLRSAEYALVSAAEAEDQARQEYNDRAWLENVAVAGAIERGFRNDSAFTDATDRRVTAEANVRRLAQDWIDVVRSALSGTPPRPMPLRDDPDPSTRFSGDPSPLGTESMVIPGVVTLTFLLQLSQGDQRRVWETLSAQQQRALIRGHESSIAELASMTPEIRYAANRQLVYEQWSMLQQIEQQAGRLDSRLTARRDLYEDILRNHRQVLFFDPSEDGRIAVVSGDLTRARHVAVAVPGISTTMETFWGSVREPGDRLWNATGRDDTAVISWLGYDTPVGVSADLRAVTEIPNDRLARAGAQRLVRFLDELHTTNPSADVTVIGHSYGSLVTGLAAKQGIQADRIVFIGSPGVGADSVADFRLRPNTDGRDQVFAMEAGAVEVIGGISFGGDPVSNIGHNRHPFGGVPTEAGFGAHVVDIGDRLDVFNSHSDYYKEGSLSLRAMAAIVRGDRP